MIYHITTQSAWQTAMETGIYRGDSLETEGFIHCSTRTQVLLTANRFFHAHLGLLLLEIDPHKVASEIRYENLEGGEEKFPHIYGPLYPAAVVRVLPFEPGADGSFTFPPAGKAAPKQ